MKTAISILVTCLFATATLRAQNIHWMDFEALDNALQKEIRPVVLYFHTDWCAYCRKMERQVFTKKEITTLLNEHYYAVKMDAESRDTIYFEGQAFVNRNAGQQQGVHELAQIFSRESGFVAPTFIVLDENFRVKEARFEYLHSEQLKKLLQ